MTPLAASLKQSGLTLDVTTANVHIGRWLQEIAHQRIHGVNQRAKLTRVLGKSNSPLNMLLIIAYRRPNLLAEALSPQREATGKKKPRTH